MDEELRNRLDALEIAMRLVTGHARMSVPFIEAWLKAPDAFILGLPDDQMHRRQGIRDAFAALLGPLQH